MPEERRVVTILFADVTGSTALGESTDPEDVRAVLGRYYAIAREVIAAHGGTLEKFIGDAVMAVFGIPQAHGDDAERALAAALALRASTASDPLTQALVLRMGVNTGEVVATREASGGDFLVTGDAVNIAARLQQSAEPGAIVAGERTCRASAGFRFGTPQRIEVKGKREPITGAVLIDRTERRAPRAPFLGREHDLAQLDLVAKRAFDEQRAQLVTITAAAGTGKSRLVEEFAARLAPSDVLVATAQCLPYGAAVTFLPLRGLIRGLLGVEQDGETAAALRSELSRQGYAEVDVARLSGLIAATLGDATDSERADREEIFNAWRLLIEGLAARRPLLVVFEDLHWASDTLVDLVEHITSSRAASRLVMVALARPELLDRRPHWGGGRRNFTSIALEPLTPAQTLQLVTILTEGVPGAIAEGIVERAGGNPFFAGELVRAYEERRRAGAPEGAIVLPDTVHATVLARIDALPPTERTVLEYAAVAGRTARVAAICALLPDLPAVAATDALDTLVERDMLSAQGTATYTFRHIVIREVAYATLPRAERVRAHVALARWLKDEAGTSDQQLAELIAYHYRQAIALSPGGRLPQGLDLQTVIAAFEAAARAAWNGAAYLEAAQQLREAIRLAPESDHLRLYELLGDVMQFGDDAIEGYEEAFARWTRLDDPDPHVGARIRIKQLSVYARWTGSLSRAADPDRLRAIEAEARELLGRAPDPFNAAKLATFSAFRIGNAGTEIDNIDVGSTRQLLAAVEDARRYHASRGDANSESEALDAIGALYRSGLGEFERAISIARERVAMGRRISMLERADAWSMIVQDLALLGRFNEAIAAAEDANDTLRIGEPDTIFSNAWTWAAYAAMLSGRWDLTLQYCERLILARESAGPAVGRFTTPAWFAGIYVAGAQLDATRLARFRSVFAAIAAPAEMPSGNGTRLIYEAILNDDPAAAHAALRARTGTRVRRAEALRVLLFDHRESIPEDELSAFEREVPRDALYITQRIALARAVDAGPEALRVALASLDDAHIVSDAARASALLALRTHDAVDRADAERRLHALGDRQYLQLLDEEW